MTKDQAIAIIESGNNQIALINKNIAKATAFLSGKTDKAQGRGGKRKRVFDKIYSKQKKGAGTPS